MIELVSADTNILIYSIDRSAGPKHSVSKEIVGALSSSGAMMPLQCLNELFFACTRKKLFPAQVVERFNLNLIQTLRIFPPTPADLTEAMQLHQLHGIQFFDALLLATLQRVGVVTFFSEDLQHGRSFGGLTVLDPFKLSPQDLRHLLS